MRRRALVMTGTALATQMPGGLRGAPTAASAPGTGALRVAVMPHSGEERRVLADWLSRFRDTGAPPGSGVETIALPPDTYKATLRERLQRDAEPADLHYWFAGARLAELAAQGLVAPLDDLWREERLDDSFGPALKRAVSWRGHVYALPLNYYQWGFYFRRSTFARLGLEPPRTWDEFLALSERTRSAGIAPTTVGAADTWTLAAWFDYFDLRLNGLAFHQSLAEGEVSFDDPRVRRVMNTWQQARERGVFLADALTLRWSDAVPFLLRDRAATLLMGNFFERLVPTGVRDDIGFFPFPQMDPRQAAFEDAPVDVLMLATRSRRPDAARAFLRWAASAQAQGELAGASGKVPTNRYAPLTGDRLARQGAELLRGSAGLAQFFDRDAPEALAQPALDAFGRFMGGTLDVDGVIAHLESARRALRRPA